MCALWAATVVVCKSCRSWRSSDSKACSVCESLVVDCPKQSSEKSKRPRGNKIERFICNLRAISLPLNRRSCPIQHDAGWCESESRITEKAANGKSVGREVRPIIYPTKGGWLTESGMGENSVNVGGLGCTVGFFSALRFGFFTVGRSFGASQPPSNAYSGQ